MAGASNKSDINPQHYKTKINGMDVQAYQVIEAFCPQDSHLSQALKYLLRAGKKEGTSYIKDVSKGLWWCARAILFRGGIVELPEGLSPADVANIPVRRTLPKGVKKKGPKKAKAKKRTKQGFTW